MGKCAEVSNRTKSPLGKETRYLLKQWPYISTLSAGTL